MRLQLTPDGPTDPTIDATTSTGPGPPRRVEVRGLRREATGKTTTTTMNDIGADACHKATRDTAASPVPSCATRYLRRRRR